MVETACLQKIRNYISNHLQEFSNVCNNKIFTEKFGKIQGEQNKRIPPEFQEIVKKEPLIANKQFYYSTELTPDLIDSNELPDQLMEYYLAGKTVNDFLKLAIGR